MSLPQNYNLLANYPHEVMVETGVFRGDSLQLAHQAGFKRIIGIDNDSRCTDFCFSRFDHINGKNSHIELVCGDSATCLLEVIKNIEVPILFFLDAHFSLLEGTDRGANPFPLLDELKQIAQHPIKTHTIIVDDILHLTHPMITGWNYTTIMKALCEINPDYKFELLANPVINNILVAHL